MENKGAILSWMKRARKFQEGMYNSLGDREWDVVGTEDMLKMKIGFALFDLFNEYNKFTDEQEKCIDTVKNKFMVMWNKTVSNLTDKPDGIYFGCVIVYLYLHEEKKDSFEVLFKVPKQLVGNKICYFIARDGRTYIDWDDFLNYNKLPECYMCYPIDGRYKVSACNDVFEVGIKKSPACNIINSVMFGMDIGSSVLGVLGTAVEVAALFCPITAVFTIGAGVMLIACSIYDVSRRVATLVDKADHEESMGLEDSDSRLVWLGIATSATSVLTAGTTTIAHGLVLSKGVGAISRSGGIALRIINVTSAATNGINIINSIITIVIKFLDGNLLLSDIVHFVSACFFFVNAIVSLKNAERLIAEIASYDLTRLFCNASNCAIEFAKPVTQFIGDDISSLRSLLLGPISELIPNYNFDRMDRSVMHLIKVVKSGFSDSKLVSELIDPLNDIWKVYGDAFKKINAAIKKFSKLFCIENRNCYKKNSGQLLLNLSPHFAQQFCLAIQKTIDHCNLHHNVDEFEKDIIVLINDIPDNYQAENAMEFLSKAQFVCERIRIKFDEIKNGVISEEELKQFNLINVKDNNVRFFKLTIVRLRNSLMDIASKYFKIKSNLPRPEDNPLMNTSTSSCYAYCFPIGCGWSTEQRFWQKAKEITKCELNNGKSTILIRNEVVLIRPYCVSCDVKAVLFFNFSGCINEWGLMSVMKNV